MTGKQPQKNTKSSIQDYEFQQAMSNYQNIKDQMQGQKINLSKNNSRGIPTKQEMGKSPILKQNEMNSSKNDYNYEIEDKNPFSSGTNNYINKNELQNRQSNNNNIYNNTKQNNQRNNTASYPYRPQHDEEEDDDGYSGNPKYSAENYSNQDNKKPSTTSSTYQKGQRAAQQQNQRKNQHQDEEYSQQQFEEDPYPKQYSRDANKRNQTNRNGSEQAKESNENTRMIQRFQKVEEGLTLCPEGCGRTFNEYALEKHVKVCKKVFQDKRKEFDVTKRRQTDEQIGSQGIKDDEQRRNEIMRKQKELHECPDCGRSFRYEIYEKHIKICVKVFTKKNRENSLVRKNSLNMTGSNQIQSGSSAPSPITLPKAPLPQFVKKGSSQQIEAETDQKNIKKPPLKRIPSSSEKKEEAQKKGVGKGSDYDQTPVGGIKQKNGWDDTPVGSSQNKNNWEETPVGGSKSKNQSWDDYPSKETPTQSVQRRQEKFSTAANSETSNNPWDSKPKQKKATLPPQQKKPWNNDWNSSATEDKDEHIFKNDDYEDESNYNQEKKKFNFNQKVKSSQTKSRQSIDKSKDYQVEQNDQEDYRNKEEDQYVYSKPNIGKKVIHSSQKSPIQQQSKVQKQQHNSFSREENGDTDNTYSSKANTFKNKPNQSKVDEYQQNEEEVQSQYTKPFLKKNQGTSVVTKPNQSKTQQNKQPDYSLQDQQVDDIPLNKNDEFNKQLLQMEREAQFDEGDLIECTEGCGRKFAEAALEKHIKICKKVFQQKRKVFNSAAHRQADDAEGLQSNLPPTNLKKAKSKQQDQSQKYQKDQKSSYNEDFEKKAYQQTSKVNSNQGNNNQGGKQQMPFDKKAMDENTKVGKKQPKWKLQSEAFRAVMKQAKGQSTNSEYENAIIKEAFQRDDYVQCQYCERRFNEQAAERHIPFCKEKAQKNQIKQGGKAKLTTQKSSTPSNRKY